MAVWQQGIYRKSRLNQGFQGTFQRATHDNRLRGSHRTRQWKPQRFFVFAMTWRGVRGMFGKKNGWLEAMECCSWGWGLKYQIKLNSQQKKGTFLKPRDDESAGPPDGIKLSFIGCVPNFESHSDCICEVGELLLLSINCCSLSFNSSTWPWHHPARCESTQLAGRAGEIWKEKEAHRSGWIEADGFAIVCYIYIYILCIYQNIYTYIHIIYTYQS